MFESLDPLFLARFQFAFTVAFHIVFPAFAISFGMGVVSGLVMSYQFGTNWGPFADKTGPVPGPRRGGLRDQAADSLGRPANA